MSRYCWTSKFSVRYIICSRLDIFYQEYPVIKVKMEHFGLDKIKSLSQPRVNYFSMTFFFLEHLEILVLCSNLEHSHISRPFMYDRAVISIFFYYEWKSSKDKQLFPCFLHWALLKLSSTHAANLYFTAIIHISTFETSNPHPSHATGGSYFILPLSLLNRKTVHVKHFKKNLK